MVFNPSAAAGERAFCRDIPSISLPGHGPRGGFSFTNG
jgi:hypothetical protein